jgi:hypothetical protein
LKRRTLQLGFSFFSGAGLLAAASLGLAIAQVNCETFPAGPARTDCYIGLSRINRQKSEISAGVAQQHAATATYRQNKNPAQKGLRAGLGGTLTMHAVGEGSEGSSCVFTPAANS